jgi:hypothetical protein
VSFAGGPVPRDSVSRIASAADVTRAHDAADRLGAERAELDAQLEQDIAALRAAPVPAITTVAVPPRKTDMAVTRTALVAAGVITSPSQSCRLPSKGAVSARRSMADSSANSCCGAP